MKIHDIKGFPNPARVRIALAEKGLLDRVKFVHVDVLAGEHRKPEFTTKNPSALVPVLELEDGTFISECSAITEYLDAEFGGARLTGTHAKERAVIAMMQRRAEQGVLETLTAYFHHATPGLGALETYQNREWGLKQRDRALQALTYFDTVLADRPYVAGQNFTVADITLFTGLALADFAKVEIPASLSHLLAWRQRIDSRPSIAAAAAA